MNHIIDVVCRVGFFLYFRGTIQIAPNSNHEVLSCDSFKRVKKRSEWILPFFLLSPYAPVKQNLTMSIERTRERGFLNN
jgi:hypothetical protein